MVVSFCWLLVFHHDMGRIWIRRRLGAMASRGHAAGESSEGHKNLAQSSFVILAGCGVICPTSFQPCKGGDRACIRGPLGAFYVYNMAFFDLESAY